MTIVVSPLLGESSSSQYPVSIASERSEVVQTDAVPTRRIHRQLSCGIVRLNLSSAVAAFFRSFRFSFLTSSFPTSRRGRPTPSPSHRCRNAYLRSNLRRKRNRSSFLLSSSLLLPLFSYSPQILTRVPSVCTCRSEKTSPQAIPNFACYTSRLRRSVGLPL